VLSKIATPATSSPLPCHASLSTKTPSSMIGTSEQRYVVVSQLATPKCWRKSKPTKLSKMLPLLVKKQGRLNVSLLELVSNTEKLKLLTNFHQSNFKQTLNY